MLRMEDLIEIVKPHNDKIVAEAKLAKAELKIARLEAILEELDDHFDDEVDVVDGPDGQPRPNDAMRWQQRIREVLGRSLF